MNIQHHLMIKPHTRNTPWSIGKGTDRITMRYKILKHNLDEAQNNVYCKDRQIAEFAYYNCHVARAPIARILGLIQLIRKEEIDGENAFFLEKIKECSLELDMITRKMNKVLLEETDFFDKK